MNLLGTIRKMSLQRFRGLTGKFVLPIVGVIVVAMTTMTLMAQKEFHQASSLQSATALAALEAERNSARDARLKALNDKSDLIGLFMAKTAIEFILSFDFGSLEAFQKEAASDEAVLYIGYLNPDETPMVAYAVPEETRTIERRYSIEHEGVRLGYVVVGLSTEAVERERALSDQRIGAAIRTVEDFGGSLSQKFVLFMSFGSLILFFVVVVVLISMFRHFVVRPLKETTRWIGTLEHGDGDLTIRLPVTHSDEIGTLRRSVNAFVGKLQEMIQILVGEIGPSIKHGAHDLSAVSGNMMAHVQQLHERTGNVTCAAEGMAETMNKVAGTVEEASANLHAISAAAEQLSTSMTLIATSTEQASVNLATVASASEETSSGIEDVRDAAKRTSGNLTTVASATEEITASLESVQKQCLSAKTESQRAEQHAGENAKVMSKLSLSAKEIDDVVELINSIAEQTNMLALNAAIEAAGAGEAGKGFAVVANEVKALARQTAEATRTISEKVHSIQKNSTYASQRAEEVSVIIGTINQANAEIERSVSDQNVMLNEIMRSITVVAGETDEVTRRVGESTTGVTEITRNVTEISTGIEEVTRNVGVATEGVEEMTRNVSEASIGSTDTSRRVAEIATSSSEILTAMSEVKGSSEKMAGLGRTVSDHSGEMLKSAAALNEMLGKFRV